MEERNAESRASSGLLLGVLGLAYALAYFDRQLLTLLVDPIRQSLGINDTQIGFIQGFAFAVCFAVGGLPLGWLVDHVNRVRLAGVCIVSWSIATSSTGFASTYAQLLLARSATALAEAGCSPAATSIFADVFPPRLLPKATAIYMAAPIIGGGAALLVGGYAFKYFEARGGLALPLLGHLAPWQSVFMTLSAPGLLLGAFVLMAMREPVRSEDDSLPTHAVSSRDMLRFILHDSRYLLSYFGAYACILTAFFSLLTWYPTFAVRSGFGTVSLIGRRVGLVFLVFGLIGTFGAQWLVGRVRDQEVVPRIMRVAIWTLSVLVLTSAALSMTGSAIGSFACYGLLICCMSVLTCMMPVPLQVGIPNRMRGRLVGVFIMSVNLIGTGLGPVIVGRMSDANGNTAHALLLSLGLILVLSTAGGLIFMLHASNRLHTDLLRRSNPALSGVGEI
jgi:MFS family permease